MQMIICIVISGNYLRYILLLVPFPTPPYVGNKMFYPPPQGYDIEFL